MKQRRWFRAIAIGFALLLAYASYDIGRRTTFPGSKPQLKDRIERNFMSTDSTKASVVDTVGDTGNIQSADTIR